MRNPCRVIITPAMDGTSEIMPSIAAVTVPEQVTSRPRFGPWLMPETTISIGYGTMPKKAQATQSDSEPGITRGIDELSVYGQEAGHDARLSTMQGVLVTAGRGVSAKEQGHIASLTDVAPSIALWLGIQSLANNP